MQLAIEPKVQPALQTVETIVHQDDDASVIGGNDND